MSYKKKIKKTPPLEEKTNREKLEIFEKHWEGFKKYLIPVLFFFGSSCFVYWYFGEQTVWLFMASAISLVMHFVSGFLIWHTIKKYKAAA